MRRINPEDVPNQTHGLYRMWNARKADEAFATSFEFPQDMGVLGRAMRIIYWSDKWKTDGTGDYYEHDFDTSPEVYCESAEHGVKSIDALTKVKDINNRESGWPVLAEVMELSLERLEGGVKTYKFSKPPIMTCSSDKKSVIILYKREPIIIRGGRMRVTARGIVN